MQTCRGYERTLGTYCFCTCSTAVAAAAGCCRRSCCCCCCVAATFINNTAARLLLLCNVNPLLDKKSKFPTVCHHSRRCFQNACFYNVVVVTVAAAVYRLLLLLLAAWCCSQGAAELPVLLLLPCMTEVAMRSVYVKQEYRKEHSSKRRVRLIIIAEGKKECTCWYLIWGNRYCQGAASCPQGGGVHEVAGGKRLA